MKMYTHSMHTRGSYTCKYPQTFHNKRIMANSHVYISVENLEERSFHPLVNVLQVTAHQEPNKALVTEWNL